MSTQTLTTNAGEHAYGHIEPVQVHFDDIDLMGIVHNVRYGLFIERALTPFWMRNGWNWDPSRSRFGDIILAVKELAITFHVPITDAGEIAVHFWVDKLGTTSIVYGFRILSADHGVVHAEGRRVQVGIDRTTGRPKPFGDDLRAAVAPLLRGDA